MSRTAEKSGVVFLLDVDNTLLDNDRVIDEMRAYLVTEVGAGRADQYFEIFEALRAELGYADYLGALQRYRVRHPRDHHLLELSSFLLDYPFADRLFPRALAVVAHLQRFGAAVILSDGDVVFQPRKVKRSGLYDAVGGRVLIYVHKERELDDVARRYPAAHYVLLEDKPRILNAVKAVWKDRVTTVFVRQGHYARAPDVVAYGTADVTVECIGDVVGLDPAIFGVVVAPRSPRGGD